MNCPLNPGYNIKKLQRENQEFIKKVRQNMNVLFFTNDLMEELSY